MIPDLGKYTVWVLSAYGVSLTLLAAIVVVSIAQSRRALSELRRMEEGRAAARVERPASGRSDTVEDGANG